MFGRVIAFKMSTCQRESVLDICYLHWSVSFVKEKNCGRKLTQFKKGNIFKYKMDCTSIECMTQVLVVSSAKEFRASERRWRNSCKGGKLFFSAPIFFFFQLSAEIPWLSALLIRYWVRTRTASSLKCLARVGGAGRTAQSLAPETHWLAPGRLELQEVRRKQAPG